MYVSIYVCVCVCVCSRDRKQPAFSVLLKLPSKKGERERKRDTHKAVMRRGVKMKGSCDTISAGHRQRILFLLTERGERFPPLLSLKTERPPLRRACRRRRRKSQKTKNAHFSYSHYKDGSVGRRERHGYHLHRVLPSRWGAGFEPSLFPPSLSYRWAPQDAHGRTEKQTLCANALLFFFLPHYFIEFFFKINV